MASLSEFPIYEWVRKRAWEQGFQQSIQEALTIRFSEDAARSATDRLAAIKQVEHLQALLRTAIQAEQLAEFTRLLDEMTDGCS